MKWIAVLFSLSLALLVPASAQMTMSGVGGGFGSGSAFSLTYVSNQPSTLTTATIAYGTLTWGSGCDAVIFGVQWFNTGAGDGVSSISVSGNAAPTQIASAKVTVGGGNPTLDAWILPTPSGTSGSVSVTYSAAPSFDSAITAYCLKSAHPTAGTATTTSGSSTSISQSVTVAAGGSALIQSSSNTGSTISLTNGTIDASVIPGGSEFVFGHTTGSGSVSVTSTVGASQNLALSLVPFGP